MTFKELKARLEQLQPNKPGYISDEFRRYSDSEDVYEYGSCQAFIMDSSYTCTFHPEETRCVELLTSAELRQYGNIIARVGLPRKNIIMQKGGKGHIICDSKYGYVNYISMVMFRQAFMNPKYVILANFLHSKGFDWAEILVALGALENTKLWMWAYTPGEVVYWDGYYSKNLVQNLRNILRTESTTTYSLNNLLGNQVDDGGESIEDIIWEKAGGDEELFEKLMEEHQVCLKTKFEKIYGIKEYTLDAIFASPTKLKKAINTF